MKETIQMPPPLRREIIENEELCIRRGDTVAVYDEEYKIGGMYNCLTAEWMIVFPVTASRFMEMSVAAYNDLETKKKALRNSH